MGKIDDQKSISAVSTRVHLYWMEIVIAASIKCNMFITGFSELFSLGFLNCQVLCVKSVKIFDK
jgi:hypothetical protein